MSEHLPNHNQAPLPPQREYLHGTETELTAPVEVPEDLAPYMEPGSELLGLATLGAEREAGADEIACLRRPDGSFVVAGVLSQLTSHGTEPPQRYLSAISGALPEGSTFYFGREGDKSTNTDPGIVGAGSLYGRAGKVFLPVVSGIHCSIRIENGKFILRDGGRTGGASTNGTWIEKAGLPTDEVEESSGEPQDQAVIDRPEILSEYEKHLRRLFAPKPEGPSEDEREAAIEKLKHPDIDLFALDDEDAQALADEYIRNKQTTSGKKEFRVTDQTLGDAVRTMEQVKAHDHELRAILQNFQLAGESPEVIVAAIRQNADVRLALGQHYVDRVDQLANDEDMPLRVRLNGQKKPDTGDYTEPMTSREYVALLCLAQLDGTFDQAYADRLSTDKIERDERTGQVTQGQHRYAASLALHTRL